ncbi:MAG: LysE family translocator [Actinomycetes bacterium]
MIPKHFAEYLATSIVIVLAPGPSVLFIIARAVSWGRVTALYTVLGNGIGSFLLSALIAVGLGPILQRSDLAYAAVQWGGGAYLVYLGIDAIRHRHAHAADMTQKNSDAPSAFISMKNGFWVAVLNPKTLVFYAAVLPQFIDRDGSNVTTQLLFLGGVFALMCLFSDGTWGFLAGTAREWLANDAKRLVTLRAIGGSVMVILGALVVIAALRHAIG